MTFEQLNLNPSISKAIIACGYTSPTSIQSRSIPEILGGKDIVASAQTGTGKTAAFVLPALDRICSAKPTSNKPRILILTPTRELATQITDAVARYGKYMQVNIISLLGGMPYHKQLKALSRPLDIIVATPGRLMDHMERGRVDLSSIEMLILDEADRMLDMGFIDDVTLIARKTPNTRQTLLFSATVDNKLATIVRNLLTNPVRIEIVSEKTPNKIKQELYYADSPQHKMRLLQHMLDNESMFKAVIFSATKMNCDRLAQELMDQDYSAAPLHGDLKQNQRNKTIDMLRSGKIQFLVATDVAARGIDISDITHVINYDIPRFSEDYVHRIGRTGRAGKTGVAISFALTNETRHVQSIERFIGQKIETCVIPGLEPTMRPKGGSSDKGKSGGRNRSSSGDKPYGYGRKKSADGDRSFGSKRSSGGERSFGSKRPSDGERSFGSKRPSDGERSFGSKRPSDGERSFGSKRPSEAGRSFGSKRSSDGDKPFGFGRKKSADGDRSFGSDRKRFNDYSDKPASFGHKKFADGDKPTSFGRKKFADGDKPASFGRKKFADGDKPASFGRKKFADGDKPASFGRKKFADGDKPASFGRKKLADGDKPTSFGRKKFADGDKPFRAKPAASAVKHGGKFKPKKDTRD